VPRDFAIRRDLVALGLPDRTIRVLEKAAELVVLIEQQAALEGDIEAINTAVDALEEGQEDANITLGTLDTRIDAFEVLAPFVREAGGTMSGALDVQALLTCDSFRIDAAPAVAAAVASTHKLAISCNGVTYHLLLSNV
jgi:hypothetical protein